MRDHHAVAPAQALVAQRQAPQPVVGMRIDPSIVENELGSGRHRQRTEHLLQPRQIGLVFRLVVQPDIEHGRDLAQRIVLLGMHGKGRDPLLAHQDVGGAVALVNVEIDHQDAADPFPVEQRERGNGDIVEGAETGATRAAGMVAAARPVAGDAVFQRQFGREKRAGGCQPGTARDPLVDRKADLALDRVRHLAGDHLRHIVRRMGKLERIRIGWFGAMDVGAMGKTRFGEHLDQPAIFAHRKSMVARKPGVVVGMVDDGQVHCHRYAVQPAERQRPSRSIRGRCWRIAKAG